MCRCDWCDYIHAPAAARSAVIHEPCTPKSNGTSEKLYIRKPGHHVGRQEPTDQSCQVTSELADRNKLPDSYADPTAASQAKNAYQLSWPQNVLQARSQLGPASTDHSG